MSAPRFKATEAQTHRELVDCFRKWRVTDWSMTRSSDHSLTVEFQHGAARFRVSCRKFGTTRENLRAIYLTIEGARMAEVRGGVTASETLAQYLLGAGPGPVSNGHAGSAPAGDAWSVLGLTPGQPAEVVKAVYRARAATVHPDGASPDAEAFKRLTAARDAALAEIGARP